MASFAAPKTRGSNAKSSYFQASPQCFGGLQVTNASVCALAGASLAFKPVGSKARGLPLATRREKCFAFIARLYRQPPPCEAALAARPLSRWAGGPPASARGSRVAPSVIFAQGLKQAAKPPLRFFPSVALSAASASAFSGSLSGFRSALIAIAVPSAQDPQKPRPRGSPLASLCPRFRSKRGGSRRLALTGHPPRWWRFPAPPLFKRLRPAGRYSPYPPALSLKGKGARGTDRAKILLDFWNLIWYYSLARFRWNTQHP